MEHLHKRIINGTLTFTVNIKSSMFISTVTIQNKFTLLSFRLSNEKISEITRKCKFLSNGAMWFSRSTRHPAIPAIRSFTVMWQEAPENEAEERRAAAEAATLLPSCDENISRRLFPHLFTPQLFRGFMCRLFKNAPRLLPPRVFFKRSEMIRKAEAG